MKTEDNMKNTTLEGSPAPALPAGLSKYDGKAIRFLDKGDRYELVFIDDFSTENGKGYADVVTDMRNADHSKELHLFIASFGGEVQALNMFLQQMLLFRHRVGVNLGMADSCGWMLYFACEERYASPFSEFMYHEMSAGDFGKIYEKGIRVEYWEQWWKSLLGFTRTEKVLTKDELKLGKTSEVFLTGGELIRRGAVQDYSKYSERKTPAPQPGAVMVGETLYVPDGDKFTAYHKDKKPVAKTYIELLEELSK